MAFVLGMLERIASYYSEQGLNDADAREEAVNLIKKLQKKYPESFEPKVEINARMRRDIRRAQERGELRKLPRKFRGVKRIRELFSPRLRTDQG